MRKGFTLVELSIVLVVVGLLIGGALLGQSLIKSSRLQAVSAEMQKYNSMMNGFKQKYSFYPGDMPNADQYWNGADNGDGNGSVSATEGKTVWPVLKANDYSNFVCSASCGGAAVATPGVSVPVLGGWGDNKVGVSFAPSTLDADNSIIMGKQNGSLNYASAVFMGVFDAVAFDKKIDDGLPRSGIVTANGTAGQCATASAPFTYVTSAVVSEACNLEYHY